MKRILALTILGMLSAPALAADLGAQGSLKDSFDLPSTSLGWTGVIASVGVSADVLSAGAVSVGGSSDLSASFRDMSVGFRVDGDYQFSNSPLVVGLFGAVGYNGITTQINESVGFTAGAAVGNVRPYGLISAEFMSAKASDIASGAGDLGVTSSGIGYGGGVEFKLSQHWVGGLEYKRIDWGTIDSADVREDRVEARFGYKF